MDYVEIQDAATASTPGAKACYTRALLKSALQLAGCKTRVAHKAAKAVFRDLGKGLDYPEATEGEDSGQAGIGLRPRRTTTLARGDFEARVLAAVQNLKGRAGGEEHIRIACSIREQRDCIVILLAGTSGTGKSTLASLLAAKMGITTVVSTDSIRHMLRSYSSEVEDPILWASTYQAGELLPKSPSPSAGSRLDTKTRAIAGYKAQCEPVMARIARLIAACEGRNESLVVEGVHLRLGLVVKLLARHPSAVPFLVHISNENKHRERFAVRAKYMTLDPGVNRYVKHLRQIRVIQSYLEQRAERYCIPRVNNTNVDRSVAAIHATILSALRRRQRGEALLDPTTKTTLPLSEDYQQCMRDAWSSKEMLQLIRSRKSAADGRAAAAAVAFADGSEHPSEDEGTAAEPPRTLVEAQAASGPGAETAVDTSDGVFLVAEDTSASSSGAERTADPSRIEGGSVVETEADEQEDDAHSDAVSVERRLADGARLPARVALQ